jgi:hypothetical protein
VPRLLATVGQSLIEVFLLPFTRVLSWITVLRFVGITVLSFMGIVLDFD